LILAGVLSTALSGCSDGDTVLALNVTLRQSATSARTLVVSITQPGQSEVGANVTIATKETDAGLVLKNNTFFERITLPSGYTEAEANIEVVAKDSAGADVGRATASVGILPTEAVAGFITLGEDPPPAAK
jgi:hypothetical protein